ncbi:unnamed protein product [Effrenium voratum]|nr:unnamed protein product [Effrenium voratum]
MDVILFLCWTLVAMLPCHRDYRKDGDGLTYCAGDICLHDPTKIYPGVCGCGVPDADTDGDGVLDCLDWCPNDANKTMPGHCGCGDVEDDTDGDGVLDCEDKCPLDPTKTNPELCGCGVADTDSDIDGTPDCYDKCPSQPDSIAGTCQCALAFQDDDGDGTANCNDLCPLDPLKLAPGSSGCGAPDTDTDGDGVVDFLDICFNDATKLLPGDCGCGVPDDDSDSDGWPDCVDACPFDGGKNLSGICGCGISDEDADGNYKADCLPECPAEQEASATYVSRAGLGETSWISVSGGQYRLCWCAGAVEVNATNFSNVSNLSFSTCSFADEYRVDLGGLLVLGVAPLQQSRTCVSGLSCVVEGITGYGLSPLDGYGILDTCGVVSEPHAMLARMERDLPSQAPTRRWLSDVVVPGLCWCPSMGLGLNSSCFGNESVPADRFRMDVGQLKVLGPLPQQHRTCVAGLPCHLEGLIGYLADTNNVLVMDTCGHTNVAGFPDFGLLQNVTRRDFGNSG